MALETKTLRRMWRFVETSNPHTLVRLSDQEMVESLIKQVENVSPLEAEELCFLSRYINARLPLIRDLAQSKLACSF